MSPSAIPPPTPVHSPAHTNWIEHYKVDEFLETQLPEIKNALQEKKNLHPSLRHELLRNMVKDMRRFSSSLGKRHFVTVGKELYRKYPDNFADDIDGHVVGSGYDATVKQLITKYEHINRKENSTKRKLIVTVDDSSAEPVSKKIRCRDQYGCVAYCPQLPSDEGMEDLRQKQQELIDLSRERVLDINVVLSLLKSTYCIQRQDIISGKTVEQLQEQWPHLFSVEGLAVHFSELVGMPLFETLLSSAHDNMEKLFNYCKKHGSMSTQQEVESIETIKASNAAADTMPGLLVALTRLFKEDPEDLVRLREVSMIFTSGTCGSRSVFTSV